MTPVSSPRKLSIPNIFSIICFSLIFSFISISVSYSKQPAVSGGKFDRVVVQLKWTHQFNFAGYYAAVEKGFYKEAGLEVTIKEGQPSMDFVSEVISGRANYGIEMPELLLARHHGKPVVVLAAIFQHSPQIILARADSGIKSPHNLIGKKVMWRFDSAAELRAMLLNEKISPDQIEFTELSWNINDLIDGKVDAIHAYITDQPLALKNAGIESIVLNPITYGIDFYGDCLFTSEKELIEHPDRVKAFREASLRGWAYAMDHPEELMGIIHDKYGTKSSLEYMQNEFSHINQLMLPKFIEIGHMNPGRWKHIGDTFVKLGMLDPKYSLEGFLYDPNPQPNHTKVMRIVWILLTVVAVITISTTILFVFYRKLNKKVRKRTKKLSIEIAERTQAEEALRQSEGQLRTLINTLPDLVWLKDSDGVYLACNPKFERFFGAKQNEIVGKTDYDFVDKDLADFFRENDKIAMTAGSPSKNEETITYADDGHTELLETIKTPMFDRNNKLIGVLGVGRDITNRKKMEAELFQAHKMEAIGTMAGGIAHDFNNILAAIIGYADMARLDISESSPARHKIDQVLKAGNRAKDLVSHILTFSRMSALQQDYETINLNSIVKEVLKFQRSIIPTTIEIKSDIDENCGQIIGDSTQIHQVIMNLCTNALHAMEGKVGSLQVSLHKTELSSQALKGEPKLLPGPYLQLSVGDTGTGLAPELIDRIFDPYFTTKEVGKGSGMGLAVVQSIVKNHGGFVKVESKQGEGSTFHIFLPGVEDEIISEDKDETKDLPTGTESILFVDDEEMLVDIGKSFLERLGYSVTTKTNSYEALDLFKCDPAQFDLVITDQTMPNIPGSELAQHILQIRPDIPIILCTGYSSAIDEMEAQKIGIREYAMKPINIKMISRLIRKVLEGAESPH